MSCRSDHSKYIKIRSRLGWPMTGTKYTQRIIWLHSTGSTDCTGPYPIRAMEWCDGDLWHSSHCTGLNWPRARPPPEAIEPPPGTRVFWWNWEALLILFMRGGGAAEWAMCDDGTAPHSFGGRSIDRSMARRHFYFRLPWYVPRFRFHWTKVGISILKNDKWSVNGLVVVSVGLLAAGWKLIELYDLGQWIW